MSVVQGHVFELSSRGKVCLKVKNYKDMGILRLLLALHRLIGFTTSSIFDLCGQGIAMATFSNEKYANIHCIYGYCNSNIQVAVKYHWWFLEYRVSDQWVFSSVYQNLGEIGTFPHVNNHCNTTLIWRATYWKWLSMSNY
jgi:hypothetical protein